MATTSLLGALHLTVAVSYDLLNGLASTDSVLAPTITTPTRLPTQV